MKIICFSAQMIMGNQSPEDTFLQSLKSVRRQVTYNTELSVEQCKQSLISKPSMRIRKQKVSELGLFQEDLEEQIEVYKAILYVLHHLSKEPLSVNSMPQEDLVQYLQAALQISVLRHTIVSDSIKTSQRPHWDIDVTVCEAKGLKAMDATGLSDPYCTLHLNSKPDHSEVTSVKTETLEPKWNEHLSLQSNGAYDDTLNIEIWDWEESRSFLETIANIRNVKSMIGAKNFFRQVKTETPQTVNKQRFMGKLSMNVKSIMGDKINSWYPIISRKSTGEEKDRGTIRLETKVLPRSYYPYENSIDAIIGYQQLAHFLFRHQNPVSAERKSKIVTPLNEVLLGVYSMFYGVDDLHRRVMELIAMGKIHKEKSLLHSLQLQFLEALPSTYQKGSLVPAVAEELQEMLDEGLQYNCSFIKNFPLLIMKRETLMDLYSCLKHQKKLEDVLKIYFNKKVNLEEMVSKALTEGNKIWFAQQLAYEEVDMHNHYKVIYANNQVLNTVLEVLRVIQRDVAPMFSELFNMQIFTLIYENIEDLILENLETAVKGICKDLSWMFERTEEYKVPEEQIGSTVFLCYVLLQEFLRQGKLNEVEPSTALVDCHKWFEPALHSWIQMASHKARLFIKGSIARDRWKAESEHNGYSCSAFDTIYILAEIVKFWKTLQWPDEQVSQEFVKSLSQALRKEIEEYGRTSAQVVRSYLRDTDTIATEVEVLIYNCSYMQHRIMIDLVDVLQLHEGITQEASCSCFCLCSSNEEYQSKILEELAAWVNVQMSNAVRNMQWKQQYEDWKASLFSQLHTFLNRLSELLTNEMLLDLLQRSWNKISSNLMASINQKENSLEYHGKLHQLLDALEELFYGDGDGLSKAQIYTTDYKTMRYQIFCRSLATNDLIGQYYKKRWQAQKSVDEQMGPLGALTVNVCCSRDKLTIDILNGQKLIAGDKNGMSDPYVILRIVPEHIAPSCPKLQTSVKQSTLFPLFDQRFQFTLPSGIDMSTLYLLLSVYDHDNVTSDDYLGEVVLSVQSLQTTCEDKETNMKLPITSPGKEVNTVLQILQSRYEATAWNFVRKQKKRSISQDMSFFHLDIGSLNTLGRSNKSKQDEKQIQNANSCVNLFEATETSDSGNLSA